MLYLAVVTLTMFLLPLGSIVLEHAVHQDTSLVWLTGRWFVFWGVGVRLTLAGARQILQPEFTARDIFRMDSSDAQPLVRELGIANIANGVVGLASLVSPSFVLPAAISAGIFYGAAGVRHAAERNRTRNQSIAMVSDLFIFVALATFVGASALTSPERHLP
eukprot:gene19736-25668_t